MVCASFSRRSCPLFYRVWRCFSASARRKIEQSNPQRAPCVPVRFARVFSCSGRLAISCGVGFVDFVVHRRQSYERKEKFHSRAAKVLVVFFEKIDGFRGSSAPRNFWNLFFVFFFFFCFFFCLGCEISLAAKLSGRFLRKFDGAQLS